LGANPLSGADWAKKVFPGIAHRLDIDTEELQLNHFAAHPDESAQDAGTHALGQVHG